MARKLELELDECICKGLPWVKEQMIAAGISLTNYTWGGTGGRMIIESLDETEEEK